MLLNASADDYAVQGSGKWGTLGATHSGNLLLLLLHFSV
jgi:hypothetical protein